MSDSKADDETAAAGTAAVDVDAAKAEELLAKHAENTEKLQKIHTAEKDRQQETLDAKIAARLEKRTSSTSEDPNKTEMTDQQKPDATQDSQASPDESQQESTTTSAGKMELDKIQEQEAPEDVEEVVMSEEKEDKSDNKPTEESTLVPPSESWLVGTDFHNWLLGDGTTEFHKAISLSKKDGPEKEPFKHKYVARDALKVLHKTIKDRYLASLPEDKQLKLYIKQTASMVRYHIGLLHIETEELGEGERMLTEVADEFEGFGLSPRCVTYHLNTLNQLGIVWAGRKELEKAHSYLQKTESTYDAYKAGESNPPPHSIHNILGRDSDKDCWRIFESAYTHCLYYLAQCYTNQPDKTAHYVHLTLKRQLESNDYDPLEWTIHCAAMSQYYLQKSDMRQAIHCLASADKIAEQFDKDSEEGKQKKADIALCWVKYFLNLLDVSREVFEGSEEAPAESKDEIVRFQSLDLGDREDVPCTIVKSFEEATVLFKLGQKYLNKAVAYYELDGFVSDYVKIQQDISQFYKNLAGFCGTNIDNACRLHKRRIDTLLAILGQLSTQHFLQVCQQLRFELAETYAEMSRLKEQKVTADSGEPDAHAVKKINKLVSLAMKYYQDFLDALKTREGEMPEKFDDQIVKPALTAHFWLARLWTKIIVPSKQEYAKNTSKSMDEYKIIIEYCKKNPDHESLFKPELEMCKEMVEMLPVKLAQILS